MRGSNSITAGEKIIDSREVIDRIEYLESSLTTYTCPDCDNEIKLTSDTLDEEVGHDSTCEYEAEDYEESFGLDSDDREELAALYTLAAECENYASDWRYGETLISEDYFEEYAQDLCMELGYATSEQINQWPFTCIDWKEAAKELKQDYVEVTYSGESYWIRSS
jgi:hypothetical protein